MKDISKPKSKAAAPEEPVIYLEADEEITAATSRMLASSGKEVRIVVPKRSTLLQSVVNQKLLKRAADNAGKSLVLVTADRTASHLAAQVGIPVATSVKAEAAIPDAAAAPEDDNSDIVEAAAATAVVAAAVSRPESAKAAAKPAYATPMMKSEPKVNNPFAPANETSVAAPVAKAGKAPKPPKAPKVKKNRNVPDFNALPKKVLIGIGAGLFAVALLFAQYYFKQATVTLIAKGQLVDVNTNFKVDTNADSVSVTTATIPGRKYEISRDLSGSTPATGTKDAGTKSSGSMQVVNKTGVAQSLVAGTRFVASGKTFLLNEAITVPGATVDGGGNVVPGSKSSSVTAENAGDSYNIAPTQYSIPALPSDKQSKIYGNGSQMSGGTSKVLKVVTQADVDKAKADAIDKDKDSATKELNDKATDSQMIMPDSFTATASDVAATPGVDNEGDSVTVKFKVTYSILTAKKTDLDTYIAAVVKKQVGTDKQIYQSGVDGGKVTAVNGAYNFTGTASAGDKIDTDALIQQIKGKRTGAATDIASKVPGVSRAEISLSPSWSVKLPSIIDHIDVQIKVEQQSKP
jgi:hypothetical protein